METKKITLNELRSLVKQIIKEETLLNEIFVSGVNYDSVIAQELTQKVGDLGKIAPYVLDIGDDVQSDSSGKIQVTDRETKSKKIFRNIDDFLKGIRYQRKY